METEKKPLVQVKNLKKYFNTGHKEVVKALDNRSPFSMTRAKTKLPITRPMPMPVNMAFLARCRLPAPMFWETKDAIDCISELGTSIAKLTILQATP